MTELAVLVPVLNRPQNVRPLVESFLAADFVNGALIFIAEKDDREEREAIRRCMQPHRDFPISYYRHDAHTWPEKINAGVKWFPADWYLFAADDITFTPGWWEATKELRDDERVGVIGTNDSASGAGNPRVAAGDHTCHPLVRASYAQLGTVDNPGEVVHSGYRHWCCDDELVYTAKLRGAWAFCREAVIQHAHPYWDKSVPWDETYAKGEANNQADMALWRYRAEHVLGLKLA